MSKPPLFYSVVVQEDIDPSSADRRWQHAGRLWPNDNGTIFFFFLMKKTMKEEKINLSVPLVVGYFGCFVLAAYVVQTLYSTEKPHTQQYLVEVFPICNGWHACSFL